MTKWEYLGIHIGSVSTSPHRISCTPETVENMTNTISKAFPDAEIGLPDYCGEIKTCIGTMELMNFLGSEGWECVGACSKDTSFLILKRPLKE